MLCPDWEDDPADLEWGCDEGDFAPDVRRSEFQEELHRRLKEKREREAGLPKLARNEARAEAREERAVREDR
ncbi:TPA: hypothetical protein DCW61_04045 [Candidatus Uhrbacteria bacterium]|nr:hypothetical protein [Candidatus Uhrbacteria bacterium]